MTTNTTNEETPKKPKRLSANARKRIAELEEGYALAVANADGATQAWLRGRIDQLEGGEYGITEDDSASLDYLKPVRDDLRKVLDAAPAEVPGPLAAIWAGAIDGTKYEGKCACLKGTIANVRGVKYDSLLGDLRPDSASPSERWFFGSRRARRR